jgi:endonuclease/exonuclease/phosphatase family metal-dependent hydrolase
MNKYYNSPGTLRPSDKFRSFCHAFLAMLLFLSFNLPLPAQQIRVMTYNIYHGEQHFNPGKSNLAMVAEVINKYKPDFVALQEVDSMTMRSAKLNNDIPMDLVAELARMTGMHGFFGKAIDYSNGGYGEGLLTRFPAESSNYSLPNPKGGEGRVLLLVSHTFPNGQKIIFAGTHLCHQYAENRLAQAKAVREILEGTKLPVIVGGDFNFTPDSEPYKVINGGFRDAALIKGNPQITYPPEILRIDFIFLSGGHDWTVRDVEVIPASASDHRPVLVTLELKTR